MKNRIQIFKNQNISNFEAFIKTYKDPNELKSLRFDDDFMPGLIKYNRLGYLEIFKGLLKVDDRNLINCYLNVYFELTSRMRYFEPDPKRSYQNDLVNFAVSIADHKFISYMRKEDYLNTLFEERHLYFKYEDLCVLVLKYESFELLTWFNRNTKDETIKKTLFNAVYDLALHFKKKKN